jgi:long-chain acyl-CoA synthetase
MPRDTLLDFFEDFSAVDEPFIVHDDGYRVREATYRQVADAAREFAARLSAAGIGDDDKVVIWSENRTEWVIAFWGALLARVVIVPIDYRASPDLLKRIADIVKAKAILVGAEVPAINGVAAPIWQLGDVAGFGNQNPTTTPPAPPPIPKASPSPTRTSSRTSCRSNER